jgi:hypothetical protein
VVGQDADALGEADTVGDGVGEGVAVGEVGTEVGEVAVTGGGADREGAAERPPSEHETARRAARRAAGTAVRRRMR